MSKGFGPRKVAAAWVRRQYGASCDSASNGRCDEISVNLATGPDPLQSNVLVVMGSNAGTGLNTGSGISILRLTQLPTMDVGPIQAAETSVGEPTQMSDQWLEPKMP